MFVGMMGHRLVAVGRAGLAVHSVDCGAGVPVPVLIEEGRSGTALPGRPFLCCSEVVVAWSEEELLSWRESLSEIADAGQERPVSGDPMFAEFVAAERERESAESVVCPVSEDWSESLDPDFAEAMSDYADRPVGPWDLDPGWSPWSAEEELEEALSSLDDWQEERVSAEVPVSAGSPVAEESVAEGGVVSSSSVDAVVDAFGLSSLPGEVPVLAEESVSEVMSEAASSLEVFVAGGRKLREGVSAGVYDAFGDRVDDDGKEARGLLLVPHDDGRAYWWAVSVFLSEVGVSDWRAAFEECRELEGFGIEHDADRVDPHVHLLGRRPRLKSREGQILKVLARLFDCRQECLSVSAVDDMRSACAYLVHESAPGKHRYRREEVVERGVELSRWLPEGSTDWVEVVSDMQYVMDSVLARRGRLTFRGFVSWCHAERPDWWRVIVQKASARRYIKDYLKA